MLSLRLKGGRGIGEVFTHSLSKHVLNVCYALGLALVSAWAAHSSDYDTVYVKCSNRGVEKKQRFTEERG